MGKTIPGAAGYGHPDEHRRPVPDRPRLDGRPASEFSEDADVVRAAYRALEVGDVQAFVRAVDPRIEWTDPLVTRLPFDGTRRGVMPVLRAAFRLDKEGSVPRLSAATLLEFGDGVLVAGRFLAGDGRPFLHECSVRRGKIFRIREFPA